MFRSTSLHAFHLIITAGNQNAYLLQLGHLLATHLHLLLELPVLLGEHVDHLLGTCQQGKGVTLERVGVWVVLPWTRLLLLLLLLPLKMELVLVQMEAPGCRAIGVVREAMGPLMRRWVSRAWAVWLALIRARPLWTPWPHCELLFNLVCHVWRRMGRSQDAAEGGGLSAGQRTHRGDRGCGAVLMDGPLGVS